MEKGSLTIEISLLMTFVLAALIMIIYSGFCLHDKYIFTKACLSAALRASEEREDAYIDKTAKDTINEVLPNKLLGSWDYDISVSFDKESVNISCEGKMNMNEGILSRVLNRNGIEFSYFTRVNRINEGEFIRENKRKGVGYCI